MTAFEKWFCGHQWKSHAKDKKSRETLVRNIIGDGYNRTGAIIEITKEVLICEKCGKIKIIEY